jgi:RNA polymerase sigma-70 factor (ECF subfamily)
VHAFDDFYQENAPHLLGFLKQLIGEAHAAEDVAQETFMQLWRQPNGFYPEKGSLRAYLFGIGRKRAADWWRKEGSFIKRWIPSLVPQSKAPQQALPDESSLNEMTSSRAAAETCSLMRDALTRIKPEHRELLWLREAEGLSYAELAQIFDVPLGTVRSRLSAAREELWRIWRNEGVTRKEDVDV